MDGCSDGVRRRIPIPLRLLLRLGSGKSILCRLSRNQRVLDEVGAEHGAVARHHCRLRSPRAYIAPYEKLTHTLGLLKRGARHLTFELRLCA